MNTQKLQVLMRFLVWMITMSCLKFQSLSYTSWNCCTFMSTFYDPSSSLSLYLPSHPHIHKNKIFLFSVFCKRRLIKKFSYFYLLLFFCFFHTTHKFSWKGVIILFFTSRFTYHDSKSRLSLFDSCHTLTSHVPSHYSLPTTFTVFRNPIPSSITD